MNIMDCDKISCHKIPLTYKTLFHIVASMKIEFLSIQARHFADKKKEAGLLNAFRDAKKTVKPE